MRLNPGIGIAGSTMNFAEDLSAPASVRELWFGVFLAFDLDVDLDEDTAAVAG